MRLQIVHMPGCKVAHRPSKPWQWEDYGKKWRFCFVCAPSFPGDDWPVDRELYGHTHRKYCQRCLYSKSYIGSYNNGKAVYHPSGPETLAVREEYEPSGGDYELVCEPCSQAAHEEYERDHRPDRYYYKGYWYGYAEGVIAGST